LPSPAETKKGEDGKDLDGGRLWGGGAVRKRKEGGVNGKVFFFFPSTQTEEGGGQVVPVRVESDGGVRTTITFHFFSFRMQGTALNACIPNCINFLDNVCICHLHHSP
jgi:hypothetical protein